MTLYSKMLKAIGDAGPKGISPRELVSRIYDDPRGGPLWAQGCIYVMAHQARKQNAIRVEGKTWRTVYIKQS